MTFPHLLGCSRKDPHLSLRKIFLLSGGSKHAIRPFKIGCSQVNCIGLCKQSLPYQSVPFYPKMTKTSEAGKPPIFYLREAWCFLEWPITDKRLKILNVLTSVVCSYKSLFYSVHGWNSINPLYTNEWKTICSLMNKITNFPWMLSSTTLKNIG